MRLILTTIVAAAALGGCASKSSEIASAYVSPISRINLTLASSSGWKRKPFLQRLLS